MPDTSEDGTIISFPLVGISASAVDNLLARQEANIAQQSAVEKTLARSTTALIDAGKRYRSS